MCFGRKFTANFSPNLNGVAIQWVHQWKYLGVVLKAGPRFGCSVTDRVKSFYRSLNSILRIEGKSDELVMLRLIESHCIPILTYAIEIVHVADRDEKRSLRVAYNAIFRRLFGYRMYESVTGLQHALKRHTWEVLVMARSTGFMNRARQCNFDSLVRAFC